MSTPLSYRDIEKKEYIGLDNQENIHKLALTNPEEVIRKINRENSLYNDDDELISDLGVVSTLHQHVGEQLFYQNNGIQLENATIPDEYNWDDITNYILIFADDYITFKSYYEFFSLHKSKKPLVLTSSTNSIHVPLAPSGMYAKTKTFAEAPTKRTTVPYTSLQYWLPLENYDTKGVSCFALQNEDNISRCTIHSDNTLMCYNILNGGARRNVFINKDEKIPELKPFPSQSTTLKLLEVSQIWIDVDESITPSDKYDFGKLYCNKGDIVWSDRPHNNLPKQINQYMWSNDYASAFRWDGTKWEKRERAIWLGSVATDDIKIQGFLPRNLSLIYSSVNNIRLERISDYEFQSINTDINITVFNKLVSLKETQLKWELLMTSVAHQTWLYIDINGKPKSDIYPPFQTFNGDWVHMSKCWRCVGWVLNNYPDDSQVFDFVTKKDPVKEIIRPLPGGQAWSAETLFRCPYNPVSKILKMKVTCKGKSKCHFSKGSWGNWVEYKTGVMNHFNFNNDCDYYSEDPNGMSIATKTFFLNNSHSLFLASFENPNDDTCKIIIEYIKE